MTGISAIRQRLRFDFRLCYKNRLIDIDVDNVRINDQATCHLGCMKWQLIAEIPGSSDSGLLQSQATRDYRKSSAHGCFLRCITGSAQDLLITSHDVLDHRGSLYMSISSFGSQFGDHKYTERDFFYLCRMQHTTLLTSSRRFRLI